MAPTAEQSPTPRPFHRFLWKGVSVVVLLFVTATVLAPLIVPADEHPDPPQAMGGDFLVAYSAGTLACEGRFAELHDPDAVMSRIRAIAAANGLPTGGGNVGPWLNPPFFLWPFMAMTTLPYKVALCLWWAITVACIAGAALLLGRMLQPTEPARRLLLTMDSPATRWPVWALVPVLTLISMPAVQTLTHGQSSAVSLLLLALTVTLWRARRAFWAGAVLGMLFYKPQLGMVVAAVMVLDLGRRAFLGLLTTGALLAGLCAIFMREELALYLRHLPTATALMQSEGVFPWHRHATFTAFWRLLLQGRGAGATAPLVAALGAAMSVAMVVPLLMGLARHRRPALLLPRGDLAAIATRRDRVIAATVSSMPLVMPYYMDYDLLLLAVPAVLFARELLHARGVPSRGDAWARRAWVAAFVWLYPSAGFAATFGVNLNVPLLATVAAMLVIRSARRDTGSETRSWAPGATPERFAAAA
jgi:hypothetical protein